MSSASQKKKVLLMGKSGSGKTSVRSGQWVNGQPRVNEVTNQLHCPTFFSSLTQQMRSIIFANYLARDTMRLSPTLDVEHSHVRFMGNLTLNLWDCGGQDSFYEKYFDSQRDHIFSKVELLIYIFDIESRNIEVCLERLALHRVCCHLAQ